MKLFFKDWLVKYNFAYNPFYIHILNTTFDKMQHMELEYMKCNFDYYFLKLKSGKIRINYGLVIFLCVRFNVHAQFQLNENK